jgi:hypothetical protein
MAITTITVYAPDDTMGDADANMCSLYRQWLAAQIQAAFPAATVDVTAAHRTHSVECDATWEDAAEYEALQELVSRSWDRCPWASLV